LKRVWKEIDCKKISYMDKLYFKCFARINRYWFIILPFVLFTINILPYELSAQVHPKYEMRGVWVASVSNIDWPSKATLSVDEQKKEMISLLDLMKQNNLNTVVFQIRPAADALYQSSLEPWSQWLTGVQGRAPEPFYDPLEFAISKSRERGIDVHVWLNPYRAVTDTSNLIASDHISKMHPEWFLTYGRTVYFDPGLPQTRDYVTGVVSEIVRKYDIDAIHMDDYFYPYRIAGAEFPDDSSFSEYSRGFLPEQKDEWRRDNVNLIIKQINDSIKAIKPWVEFGVSPFGVWRNSSVDPSGSATRAGQTNYDDLFADVLLWQKNRWIDYIVPQIYWNIGFEVADYSVLVDWWSHNTYGCKLYIGQAPYRINRSASSKKWRTSKEIIRQIKLNRTYPDIAGSMFFSERVFRNNPLRLNERLTKKLYRFPALSPSNNRIVPIIPQCPSNAKLEVQNGLIQLSWKMESNTKKIVIYKLRKGRTADLINPENIIAITSDTTVSFTLNRSTDYKRYNYFITSISQTNTESDPEYFKEIH
jgi:uncharacterized lipoprotein YddW (UPF0748 family)